MAVANEADFHNLVHASVGTPSTEYKTSGHHKVKRKTKINKLHVSDWATSKVNIKLKTITTNIYIDFQQNNLSKADYLKLVNLAKRGIQQYWSRQVDLDGDKYHVAVNVTNRKNHSIDVDLGIEPGIKYARSHNSGIIDASFIYNKGFYRGMNSNADRDFMLVAAHEFGHSVLEYFGGADLSWGHKGSTNKYLQNIKKTTPGYPSAGEIDLMKYYDRTKSAVTSNDRYTRTIADEIDVKRLIWMSKATFIE